MRNAFMPFIKAWAAASGVTIGKLVWDIFSAFWPAPAQVLVEHEVNYLIIGLITTLAVYYSPANQPKQ